MSQTIGTDITRYLWDGNQIIRELNAGGQPVATLVHGLGLGADIGSLVKAERSGQGQYFHYDWRGSVIALTDPTEQAIQTYNYDAFGTVTDSSGSAVNPYQFSSKQFDSNSGLSYFGRRHYSSSLGRFVTQDPKEYVDGLNTYAYVKNNPVNWIDTLGLACGPGDWGDWIIPDAPGGFDFESCCQGHDDCYGEFPNFKSVCDDTLYGCMLSKCSGYGKLEDKCNEYADLYYDWVVGTLGDAAFFASQYSDCRSKGFPRLFCIVAVELEL